VTHVLLFARAPRAGQVKTRLAADIGSQAALEVYREIGARVVRQIAPQSTITVWYEPQDAADEMRAWLGDLRFRAQPDGDLGARLAGAFEAHFAACPGLPAMAIGADVPGVDAGVIADARAALDNSDVVIGPARDGGYYLIGLARPLPGLFQDIPWGTGEVFGATLAACRAHGVEPAILPERIDVDRVHDLTALGLWPS
jgi:rSAM/selenodomain-associated transferase 1